MVGRIRTMVLFMLIGCCLASPLSAEVSTTVDITVLQSILYREISGWKSPMVASGTVTFAAGGQSNAKGEVALRISSDATNELTADELIDQAWVRLRFPKSRITLGKARLTWGFGSTFNAGRVLAEDPSKPGTLDWGGIQDNAHWLVAAQVPTGPFSFAEAALLPSGSMDIREMVLGLRYYDSSHPIGYEFGYASGWDSDTLARYHHPYVCLQGNCLIDWQIGISGRFIPGVPVADSLTETAVAALTLTHMLPIGWEGSLSLRLELLAKPMTLAAGVNPATDGDALLVYPEIVWNISDSGSLLLRSMVSPIDCSAVIIAGGVWRVMQGVTCMAYAQAAIGESSDTLSAPAPGYGLVAGCSLNY